MSGSRLRFSLGRADSYTLLLYASYIHTYKVEASFIRTILGEIFTPRAICSFDLRFPCLFIQFDYVSFKSQKRILKFASKKSRQYKFSVTESTTRYNSTIQTSDYNFVKKNHITISLVLKLKTLSWFLSTRLNIRRVILFVLFSQLN